MVERLVANEKAAGPIPVSRSRKPVTLGWPFFFHALPRDVFGSMLPHSMQHLAVIIDGNRRWAEANGLPAFEGHRRGYENVKTIARAAYARGLTHFTVFAFSTENWKRAKDEVAHLMGLLMTAFTTDLPFFAKENIRLRVIGRREGLSDELVRTIDAAETETAGHDGGQLNICFNYGGRAEITDAVRALFAQGVKPEAVTEGAIASKLWKVRWSGAIRRFAGCGTA